MKALLSSLVIVLAAALPAALLAQSLGFPLFTAGALEDGVAAFASGALILTVLADYLRRPCLVPLTPELPPVAASPRGRGRATNRSPRRRVGSLTGAR